jgi:hypothetical protein
MTINNHELVSRIYKTSTQIRQLSQDKQEQFIQACIAYSTLPDSARTAPLADLFLNPDISKEEHLLFERAWMEICTIIEKENSGSSSSHPTETILQNKLFDIYLPYPHSAIPLTVFSDLITDEDIKKVNAQTISKKACFLELNLSLEVASTFYKRLRNYTIMVEIVPSEYRQPKITIEMARPIANKAIKAKYARLFPNFHHYERAEFYCDEPMFYTFSSQSDEFHAIGRFEPDALFALVDKVDGHVWAELEYAYYTMLIGLKMGF